MKINSTPQGDVICGNAFSEEVKAKLGTYNLFPLIICDPPYGDIVKQKEWFDLAEYIAWMKLCADYAAENATICMWGGTGKYKNRPFITFASQVELEFPEWELKNWITWGKKRAYGVSDNYLYTREECLILTRGNPTFNIPLLDTKRGYAGYNEEYPAKSDYLRRTNVWTDINELFRDKIHPCQKPDKLYEVLINTHSKIGDNVLDVPAGSGTTARAAMNTLRRFVIVEKEISYLEKASLM